MDGGKGGEFVTARLSYRGKSKSGVFIVGVRLEKIPVYKPLYMV